MEQETYKRERKFIIFLLIVIIIILLLFFLTLSLGSIEHRPKIPTGNVDIFDIIIKEDCSSCDCGQTDTKPSKPSSSDNGKNLGTSVDVPEQPSEEPPVEIPPEEPPEKDVEVFDRETEYATQTKLNIFNKTAYYVVDDKIAPGSDNSYQFVIRNNNDFNILYDLELLETNDYNINMKYRLKLNGDYVVGNDNEWVTASEIKNYQIGLPSSTYDVYTLDWQWFESSNDTQVGLNVDAKYKLEIKIMATQS